MIKTLKNVAATGFILGLVMISCEKKVTEDVAPKIDSVAIEEPVDYDTAKISKSCYLATTDTDTIFISLENNLGTLVGTMKTQKNSGDIFGAYSGDTLKVNYASTSGETKADREIWFLKKDNQLLEAVGDYDASGSAYNNYKKLKFEGGKQFIEGNCEELGKTYQ